MAATALDSRTALVVIDLQRGLAAVPTDQEEDPIHRPVVIALRP
jgi:hypothetical protein